MSDIIREAQDRGSVKSLVAVTGLAFFHGAVHAAGPGHGKFVAVSYVMSHKVSVLGGMLFGLAIAVVHGLSGL